MRILFCWLFVAHCTNVLADLPTRLIETQVVIIGGGASGTMAGIQAARMGAKAVIVEETPWLGGMLTAAGVSATDGNEQLPAGLWGEFRQELRNYYGSDNALSTGWVSSTLFEPSVGAKLLRNMTRREPNLSVLLETTYTTIYRTNKGWIVEAKNKTNELIYIKATVLIDATELGDVAAKIGVPYDVGMESRAATGESVAPPVANSIVQDMTYVAILKNFGIGTDKTIPRPIGYDSTRFLCACRLTCPDATKPRLHPCDKMISYGQLPNQKYMINWPIEGNDFYANVIDLNPDERSLAFEQAKQHTLQFVYFIQTTLGYKHLGLADDEYPSSDLLPFMPYHRESRRIRGMVRFTQNHIVRPFEQAQKLYRTGIAVGDYPIDHHHAKYPANVPDLHFVPVPSFCLPLGSLIPQEIDNLIVAEKSISVSNIVNGTTRLQPVVLQIGQAAGALAALSVKNKLTVRSVPVRQVQDALLKSRAYLMPYLDIRLNDKHFAAIQRIGATGILKGVSKSVNWSNQTWFYPDSTIRTIEFWRGLKEFEADFTYKSTPEHGGILTVGEALDLIFEYDKTVNSPLISFNFKDSYLEFVRRNWPSYGIGNLDMSRPITRLEVAVLLDRLLDPFHLKSVDIEGNLDR
jgi:hypothetical protein